LSPDCVSQVLIDTSKKLQVYGNIFDCDTRTILTLLDIGSIEYEFINVDIFKGEHKAVAYLAKNPCGMIPMILDQNNQLMGSPAIFCNYLTGTKEKLKSYGPREHEAKINQYANWFMSVMRPATLRLT